MSKLYAGLIVTASLLGMAALGVSILVAITDAAHLVAPTNIVGMNR